MRRSNHLFEDILWVWKYPSIPTKYLSLRKLTNYYYSQFHWLLGRQKISSHPYTAAIELTNICNLKCPQCPTGIGNYGRKPSMIDINSFKRVFNELAPYLFYIDLHNWGEPLLHKNVFDITRLCEDQNVMTLLSTNFNVPFDKHKAEELVKSGLSILGVSIDGIDSETYRSYRVNGSFEKVLFNISLVQAAKKKLSSASPRVVWSFLAFKHNQHLIGKAKQMAKQLDMEFQVTRGISHNKQWLTDDIHIHPVDDVAIRGPVCRQLYTMAVVNADLGVSPCCFHDAYDSNHDFGDVNKNEFKSVWNAGKYRNARKLFKNHKNGRNKSNHKIVCENCVVYLKHMENINGAE